MKSKIFSVAQVSSPPSLFPAKIKQFGIGKLMSKDIMISDLQKALSLDKKAVQAVEEALLKKRHEKWS